MRALDAVDGRIKALRENARLEDVSDGNGVVGLCDEIVLDFGVWPDVVATEDGWDAPVEGVGKAL